MGAIANRNIYKWIEINVVHVFRLQHQQRH